VAFYSKEMTVKQMRRRCASILSGLDDGLIRTGKLSPEEKDIYFDCLADLKDSEKEAGASLRRCPALLFLSDKGVKGGSTVEKLRARIEQFEPDILFVDGFYLMRDGRSGKKDRDHKTVGNISADLKALARDLNITIFGTTQANREANKGFGDDLSEVAFADAIAQDSDLVMRCVKGKSDDGWPELLFTFPGVRDAEVRPFTINARPGIDFSLRKTSVNVKEFTESAKRAYLEDQGVDEAPKVEKPMEPAKRDTSRRGATKNRIRS
jgi:hypothetical protein